MCKAFPTIVGKALFLYMYMNLFLKETKHLLPFIVIKNQAYETQ